MLWRCFAAAGSSCQRNENTAIAPEIKGEKQRSNMSKTERGPDLSQAEINRLNTQSNGDDIDDY